MSFSALKVLQYYFYKFFPVPCRFSSKNDQSQSAFFGTEEVYKVRVTLIQVRIPILKYHNTFVHFFERDLNSS
jgi:hypothetical protein